MTNTDPKPCHGDFPCLRSASDQWLPSHILKPYQKIKSYFTWHIENGRLAAMLGLGAHNTQGFHAAVADNETLIEQEVLALKPGELVEVKSIDEILDTLDRRRRCEGLLWMSGMRKFCGGRYRVHKRVERIVLETNGELRTMKNTVLLETVMCDGKDFGNCDRSCFHFWREAWLRRVPVS